MIMYPKLLQDLIDEHDPVAAAMRQYRAESDRFNASMERTRAKMEAAMMEAGKPEPCPFVERYGTHALPEPDGSCIACDRILTEADVLATASDLGYGPVDPAYLSDEPF